MSLVRWNGDLHGERAEVHFVNAFEDFRAVPDRKALIEDIGIDKERVHIKIGTPEKVIVDQVARFLRDFDRVPGPLVD